MWRRSTSKTKYKKAHDIGSGFTQDKALELFWNASNFMNKHLTNNPDRVFTGRLGFRTYLIVASNEIARDFFENSNDDDFYNGLKDFFFNLFGDSILFANLNEAAEYKNILMPLFDSSIMPSLDLSVKEHTDYWINELKELDEPQIMYHQFKKLSLSVNLRLFLGVDIRHHEEVFTKVSELCTTHWHGIISVPLNVKLFISSSYRKALDAKDELLKIIEERLMRNEETHFLDHLKDANMDPEVMKNHLLIFVCALIPKAAASILSSFMDTSHLWSKHVSPDGDISDEDLEKVLLEVMRLFPPFIGSSRVAQRDTEVSGYLVPKGHGVFTASFMAHRDPEVFPHPDEFLPERWSTFNKDDRDKIFTFGKGVHQCIGEKFMHRFFRHVARCVVKEFKWDHVYENRERKLKYLPVTRPAELLPTQLIPREAKCDPVKEQHEQN